jgi:hypothetical protein
LIARVADGCVVVDLRTIFPADDDQLVAVLRTALS